MLFSSVSLGDGDYQPRSLFSLLGPGLGGISSQGEEFG